MKGQPPLPAWPCMEPAVCFNPFFIRASVERMGFSPGVVGALVMSVSIPSSSGHQLKVLEESAIVEERKAKRCFNPFFIRASVESKTERKLPKETILVSFNPFFIRASVERRPRTGPCPPPGGIGRFNPFFIRASVEREAAECILKADVDHEGFNPFFIRASVERLSPGRGLPVPAGPEFQSLLHQGIS